MKRITELKLMCYKLEVMLSIDAWFFLHGATEGRENIYCFLSLLSKMAITDTPVLKRGQGYTVKAGQVDGSILGLSKEWEIGRKATTRLLENFSNLGIIKVESNPLTSIITTMCIKEWMINKAMLANPCFSTTAKGTPVIRLTQKKTRTDVKIPIMNPNLKAICEKYNYNLPVMVDVIINRYIKEILKELSTVVPSLAKEIPTKLTMKQKQLVEKGELTVSYNVKEK